MDTMRAPLKELGLCGTSFSLQQELQFNLRKSQLQEWKKSKLFDLMQICVKSRLRTSFRNGRVCRTFLTEFYLRLVQAQ